MNKALAQILTFITILTIHSTDINDLNFETIEHESCFGICQMNEIKITKKNGGTFKIKTSFKGPDIEGHKMDGKYFDLELPIKIYYDGNFHKDKDKIERIIKRRLSNIVSPKNIYLNVNTLTNNFYDSYLLIHFHEDDSKTCNFNIHDNAYNSNEEQQKEKYYGFFENVLNSNYTLQENLKEKKDSNLHFKNPDEIHIVLKNEKKPDMSNLIFSTETYSDENHPKIELKRIKLTGKNGKEFRILTVFNGPNIQWHPMKDDTYYVELPIEIYYDAKYYTNQAKTLNDIKNKLNNAINDEILDFDKLTKSFTNSYIVIMFDKYSSKYCDMFLIPEQVYYSPSTTPADTHESYTYSTMIVNNNKINEVIPKSNANLHFQRPLGIRIIFRNVPEENKTTNLDITKTKAKTKTKTKTESCKDSTTHIPNITKTKDQNKTTSDKTPKNSGCCKCCGCCPCNKQPN